MKHKIITMLLSTVLFLSVFSLSVGTQKVAAASDEGIVTASTLNLRQSSSTTSKSLALLPKGTKVHIKSLKNNWMVVYVPSKKRSGWVDKKYISITKSTTVKTASATTNYYVTASSLNIRQSPTTSSKVVASAKKGATVTYYSKSGNWAKVKTASGITGWASMSYLSKTKPASATTAGTKTYYVKANSLKVMASSSRQAKVLTTIKKGASVKYLSAKNSWGQIKTTSGITGWVANRDLTTNNSGLETVSNDKIKYVTSDTLNIRKEGNADAAKVGVAKRGDALNVVKTASNGWGEIITEDGLTGWVNLSFLSDSVPTNGLNGKIIVVDPGHGGSDPGAVGKESKEKDLTLSTAKILKAKLEAAGATVYMTRTGDSYPSLDARVAYSKQKKADIFISIHYNSGSSSANGIETYYWTSSKNEKALATQVQKEVIESTGLKSRGVKTANYRVIGTTTTTQSILVELGFISNPNEEKVIETSSFQNKAATGIVNGLEAYFESL